VAAAEIFADGDDDSQIKSAVGKEPLVFQSLLAYEIIVSKPQFQVWVIEQHSVGFEDKFDKIEAAFFTSRSCWQYETDLFYHE